MFGDLIDLIHAPLGPTMLVVGGALCLSYLSLFAACWHDQYGRRPRPVRPTLFPNPEASP